MASGMVTVDGTEFDLRQLGASGPESLVTLERRAAARDILGPDGQLGFGAASCASSVEETRDLLVSRFGLPPSRAKSASRLGWALAHGSTTNEPLGYLAGVKISRSQAEWLTGWLGELVPTSTAPDAAQRNTYAFARKHWRPHRFVRVTRAAARSSKESSALAAAAMGSFLSLKDPMNAVDVLSNSLANVYANRVRSTVTARKSDRILGAAYAMAALSPDGMNLDGPSWTGAPPDWRLHAAPWVLSILDPYNGHDVAALLNATRARGLGFVDPGRSPFPFADDPSALANAQRQVRVEAGKLTKWADRPMWFDGGSGLPQVLLVQDDDRYSYAWVGVDGKGVLVAMDIHDGVPYGLDEPGVRSALALATAWHIDVAISIRKSPAGIPTMRRAATGKKIAGTRYVPTPTFDVQRRDVRAGTHSPPRMHGVLPFLRTLTDGAPSASARARAPKRLRRIMKDNQTYVRGHVRGAANLQRQLESRLSKWSALADTLAKLDKS